MAATAAKTAPARNVADAPRELHREPATTLANSSAPPLARLNILKPVPSSMGPEESQRMIDHVHRLRSRLTVQLVEHDMDAVCRLAGRISVLVAGRDHATGAPQEIRRNADVRRAYLGGEAPA